MKKLLVFALSLTLLLACLTGCFLTEEEPTEKTFTFGAISITLPAEFEEISNFDALKVASENYKITIYPTSFSSITPNPGYSFPTLEEFYVLSGMLGDIEASDIKQEEGLKIVETSDAFYALFESDSAFYYAKFENSVSIDYLETARPLFIQWAKTITFNAPVETEA